MLSRPFKRRPHTAGSSGGDHTKTTLGFFFFFFEIDNVGLLLPNNWHITGPEQIIKKQNTGRCSKIAGPSPSSRRQTSHVENEMQKCNYYQKAEA